MIKKYPTLFSPIKIGPMTLKHRAIMSGHGMGLGDGGIGISRRFHNYLLARAKGGAAMIGSESAPVHESTVSRSLGIRLYDDKVIPSLRLLSDEIHEAGSRLAIILWHGGHKDSYLRGGYALAPSPVPNIKGEVPKEITVTEIKSLINAYGEAALRCCESGLDAVELQTSTDYLLGSFLSPVLNRRKDSYGGTFENRLRFIKQILESIKEKTKDKIAVGIRTSVRHDIPNSSIDYGLEESVASMKSISEDGYIDYLSLMTGSGWAPPRSSSIPNMTEKRIQLEEEGKKFKKNISVPIIIAGRIRSPSEAENVVRNGSADLIAMARTWIADPEWANKIENDEEDRIRPCMSCNQSCVGFVFQGIPGSCIINPAAGRENEYNIQNNIVKSKRVSVIGGGPAGLEASRLLAIKGHKVTLYEKSSMLGGQMRLAVNSPFRSEMKPALDWWNRELERLRVNIQLNKKINCQEDIDADEIIWATGASPSQTSVWRLRPYLFNGIPGTLNLPSGREYLDGKINVLGSVLVIDEEGGWPAVSTVESLAIDSKVSKVSVTTPEKLLSEMELNRTWELKTVLNRIKKNNKINVYTETLVSEVKNGTVILENKETLGKFDIILMNTGTKANVYPEGSKAIGDCIAPRGIWASTNDAARLVSKSF